MEKIDGVLERVIPTLLPEGCSDEELVTWEEIREQDFKAGNYILASMSNELQRRMSTWLAWPALL